MNRKAFEELDATLKEAKALTQQMSKLTKRNLEIIARLERNVNGFDPNYDISQKYRGTCSTLC